MKCCDFHGIDCSQGDQCPIRIAGLSRLAAKPPGTSTPQPQGDADDLYDDTGLMLARGIALLVFVVSAISYASFWL